MLAGATVPCCLGRPGVNAPSAHRSVGLGFPSSALLGIRGQQDTRHSIWFVIKCLNLQRESFFFFHCHLQEKRRWPFPKKGAGGCPGRRQRFAAAQWAGQRLPRTVFTEVRHECCARVGSRQDGRQKLTGGDRELVPAPPPMWGSPASPSPRGHHHRWGAEPPHCPTGPIIPL